MKKTLLFLSLLYSTITIAQSTTGTDAMPRVSLSSESQTIDHLEIPATKPTDQIITHTGYTLSYIESAEQANWVAYDLTKSETYKVCDRTDQFIVDTTVKTGSADATDYKGSGYDRGHLAPAADMGYSTITMEESFYFSNMSPQAPAFNRGIWKDLESLVRTWAREYNTIYVVTGPILTPNLPTIGHNGVAIPKYYYKVILNYTPNSTKAIGFILQNQGSDQPLQSFAVPIDSVETLTGIDFFPKLPDTIEPTLESNFDFNLWSWTTSTSSTTGASATFRESEQCNGTTQKGARCKIKVSTPDGYCHYHINQAK